MPVIAANGDDEALRIANSDSLGLQAAVFTQSLQRAFRFSQELRVGSVVVHPWADASPEAARRMRRLAASFMRHGGRSGCKT